MSAAVSAVVTLTPAMMAEAFWDMGSDDQSEFFDELARVIREDGKTNKSAYSMGELQWHYLAERMHGATQGTPRAMLMAIAAPLYLHVLRVAEGGAA